MEKCRSYCISRQVLISCLICQVLTNISVMAVGACIAIDPRKADVKGHGFIMLILSVMFLCILAVGAVGIIKEYNSILLLFAALMVVGFLVGGFTHIMVFLTSTTQENKQKLQLYFRNVDGLNDLSPELSVEVNGRDYIHQSKSSKLLKKEKLEFNYQVEVQPKANENTTKIKSSVKESLIYIMVFDYASKILCIACTGILVWILW